MNIEEDLCLICWQSTEKHNIIKKLSHFSDVSISCKCNPYIHQLCLINWISKHNSCPICRTKIYNYQQKYFYTFTKYKYMIKFMYYIIPLYFIYFIYFYINILFLFDDFTYTDIY
jgi:hypothetical protein